MTQRAAPEHAPAPDAEPFLPHAGQAPASVGPLTPAVVLALQATAGNAAVTRMLGRGVLARETGVADVEHRGARWHLTADPPSATIPSDTTVRFSVENTAGSRVGQSLRDPADRRAEPAVIVEWAEGDHWRGHEVQTRRRAGGWLSFEYRFRHPGRRRVRVGFREYGPHAGAELGAHGVPDTPPPASSAYELTYELQITGEDHVRGRDSGLAADIAAADARALADSPAGGAEALQLFRRVATQRALERLEANRREALRLGDSWQGDDSAGRVQAVTAAFDLHRTLGRIGAEVQREEHRERERRRMPGSWDYRAAPFERYRRLEEELASAQERIRARYPEVTGMLRHGTGREGMSGGETRAEFAEAVTRTLQAIAATRQMLATGELDVLECRPIVAETRAALDPGARRRVEAAIAVEGVQDALVGLSLFGVSVALLFVPYVGTALSAAIGLGQAAGDVGHAVRMGQAAQAGLTGGVVADEDVAAAQLTAVLSTAFAAVDLAGLAQAARATRAVERFGEAIAGGSRGIRAAEGSQEAARGVRAVEQAEHAAPTAGPADAAAHTPTAGPATDAAHTPTAGPATDAAHTPTAGPATDAAHTPTAGPAHRRRTPHPAAVPHGPATAAAAFRERFPKVDGSSTSMAALTEIFERSRSGGRAVTPRPGEYLPMRTRGATPELRTIIAHHNRPEVVRIELVPASSAGRTPDMVVHVRGPDGTVTPTRVEVTAATGGRRGYQPHGVGGQRVPGVADIVAAVRRKIRSRPGRPSQLDVPMPGVPAGGTVAVHLPRAAPGTSNDVATAMSQLAQELRNTPHVHAVEFYLPGAPPVRYVRDAAGGFSAL